MLNEEAALGCLKLYSVGDSCQSSEDKKSDRNAASKEHAKEISTWKYFTGCCTTDCLGHTLADHFSAFFWCPESLAKTEIKSNGLSNLAEIISGKSNAGPVAWLM